jgi:glycosyltransferase involved in cell wall biosynthesis
MKIGVLSTSYPRSEDDPAGHFVAGLSRYLTKHYGDVEVVCAADRGPLFYRGGAPSALRHPSRWLPGALFSTRLLCAAARRVHCWDALISHWLVPSAAVGLLLARGRPHLTIAHGSDVAILRRLPGGVRWIRRLSTSADLVYVARTLAEAGAPGRVVPMGIHVAQVRPQPGDRERMRRRLRLSGLVALFLGRLVPEKGVDLLMKAIPRGARLIVAGSGPERVRLERLASDGVQFLGEIRGAEKRHLLAAADVLVIPSRVDGAPTVAREALAAGVPVLASRVGGLPELIRDGVDGLLVAPITSAFAQALARLRDEPLLLAHLRRGADRDPLRHDWETVGAALVSPWLGEGIPKETAGTLKVQRV